jgi:hypothetical protein
MKEKEDIRSAKAREFILSLIQLAPAVCCVLARTDLGCIAHDRSIRSFAATDGPILFLTHLAARTVQRKQT